MTAITHSISSAAGRVRPFDIQRDLKQVAALVEACFADTLDREGRRYIASMHAAAQNTSYLSWVVRLADKVPLPLSGYVWDEGGYVAGNLSLIPFTTQGRRYYLIANVAVDPVYRQRGIARAMTATAIAHSRRRSAHAIWLHVREENIPAIRLYTSHGFTEVTRRTTWELDDNQIPAITAAYNDLDILPRLPEHWPQQQAWLKRDYPPSTAWHSPLSQRTLRPGLLGFLSRLSTAPGIEQWSLLRGRQLRAVISVQPAPARSAYLLLATAADVQPVEVQVLLARARLRFPERRFVLELPVGLHAQPLVQAGFTAFQTLIWMTLPLSP